MSEWQVTETAGMPDPLADFHHRPIISAGGKGMVYVGRIIIELWDIAESARDSAGDSYSIAVSADAHDGDAEALAKRVASAFPERMKRDNLFKSA